MSNETKDQMIHMFMTTILIEFAQDFQNHIVTHLNVPKPCLCWNKVVMVHVVL